MNKQELIGCYQRVLNFVPQNEQRIYRKFIKQIKELNESKKVTVPKFVADWYEECKNDLEHNIWSYIYNWGQKEECYLKEWFNDQYTEPFKTLVNMHQFGYEVEPDKKYLVRMKGIVKSESYLKYNTESKCWYLGNSETYTNNIVKHTLKDLEDNGFKDVFSNPLFEIVEVE